MQQAHLLPVDPGPVERLRSALNGQLGTNENVLGTLEVDLDGDLRFAPGLLTLTDQRLLACEPGGASWRSWPL
ncbi:MAG TPA: hypothetical protein VFV25_07165, partial [Methylibium sp.]